MCIRDSLAIKAKNFWIKFSSDSFLNLLENCEIARYSPATDAKMQQDFDQALNVIATIDRKL